MLRPFLANDVMSRDQIARSAAEEPRRRSARSDLVAQLFHLLAHRFLAERRLVEIRPAVDGAMPLRTDLSGGDVRRHRGEACGDLLLEVNEGECLSREKRTERVFFLPNVDAR